MTDLEYFLVEVGVRVVVLLIMWLLFGPYI